MAKLTPEQIVEKQLRNSSNAVADYRAGVRGTRKDPMRRAIDNLEKMKQNFIEAIDNGVVEDGLNAVTLQEWKEVTSTKGGDRYFPGMQASKNKLLEFQRAIAPVRERISAEIDAMPNTTFDQRMARMVANATALHDFKFRRRRGRLEA